MRSKEVKSKFEISLIFAAIFLITILLITWFIIHLINSAEERIVSDMGIQLTKLERSFSDKIDHRFFAINSINLQITEDSESEDHLNKIIDISSLPHHESLTKKIDSYPYIFLLDYNKKAMKEELLDLAYSHLIEILSIAFCLIILLIFIYREKQQTRKTLQLKRSAELANNNKTAFLIKTNHEFKNFVFGIQGCAEIIKNDLRKFIENLKKEESPRKNNYLRDLKIDLDLSQNIIDATHDLDNFLNDLINFNNSKDGRLKIKRSIRRPVNIAKIINLAVTSLKKRTKKLRQRN